MEIKIRRGERGGARLKFLVVVLIIAAIAYAGYLYVPVAYDAYLFKDLMTQKVTTAAAMGHPPNWVKEQLVKSAPEYGVPADAEILPVLKDGRVEVQVQFTRPVEFPGYVYQYNFDHIARSNDFLSK